MAQRQRASPDPQLPLTPRSPTTSPRSAAGASAQHRTTSWPRCHRPTATGPLRPGRRDRHRPLQLGLVRPGLATTNASSRTPSSPGLATSSPDSAPAPPSSADGSTNCPSATRTTSWTCCSSTSAYAGRSSSSSKLAGQNPLASPSSASPRSLTTCSADPEHGDQASIDILLAADRTASSVRPARHRHPLAVSTYTNGPALPSQSDWAPSCP